MQQMKGKEGEVKVLNLVLLGLAGLCVLAALWAVVDDGFKAGTDDLFLILTCLMLALLFAVPVLLWARSTGRLHSMFGIEDEPEPAAEVAHAAHAEHAHAGSNKENVIVWGGLLALTAVEVFLAYIHIDPLLMLIILILLSVVKAALIVAYFMHLKFERLSLVLTIVPTLVVLFCLFAIFFPDSNRAHRLRPPEPAQQVEHSAEGEK
ncbi:MAG TPA: cytochrome C oxidase subunit IV family protein [Blastocatellia bacterium]|jgi:caa(3)-type oxidase subunit IV|nr:cytochrome C oxidase subunit IV family protein [Blastocatellia bacterium]